MKEDKFINRTILLELITERSFSLSTENEIMLLFGNINPSRKEEAARQAIPLVEQSKTEQEALQKVKALITAQLTH